MLNFIIFLKDTDVWNSQKNVNSGGCHGLLVSYNYTSDFLTSNGESEQYNVYYDKVSYLDANIDYYLGKKIVLYASDNNLLNEIQRTYQSKPEYTYASLENGARIQVGVKFNIY